MREKQSVNMFICILTSIAVGIVSGACCVFFCYVTTVSDATRQSHEWLLWFLPLAGLLVVFLYDELFEKETLNMGTVFLQVSIDRPMHPALAPLIFISTSLAYLTGGSVGRAGPALQIGAGTASILSGLVPVRFAERIADRVDSDFYVRLLMSCGVACGFTAILDAPIAGALFGIEVLTLSLRRWILIVPTLIASFITWGIAHLVGVPYVDLHLVQNIDFDFGALWRVCIIALACTLVARLYCWLSDVLYEGFLALTKNKYLRVLIGAGLVILITKLLRTTIYNGIGFETVGNLLVFGNSGLEGMLPALAFLWKLLLTLLTLCCGIRGGEIAPNIFIGAAFGYVAGGLIGLDPCLGAACGLIGNLSSVTNCTLSLFVFGLEAVAFGPAVAIYFAVTCLISYFFSGRCSIYPQQTLSNLPFKPDMA